jgi:hypothetical protein
MPFVNRMVVWSRGERGLGWKSADSVDASIFGGYMGKGKQRVLRSLRARAKSMGVDVSGMSDEQLEQRLIENSKKAASQVLAGMEKTAKKAASRVAKMRSESKDRGSGA